MRKPHKTRTVAYRRKRQGKTNYNKRLKILLSGKPRLVIRKSLTSITAQIAKYDENGDNIIVSVNGNSLKKFGWQFSNKNISGAYLIGLLAGKNAVQKGIRKAVLDIGLNKSVPGSKIYAVLKGAIDSGLHVPHSEEILPSEERLTGKHIEDYAAKIKDDETQYKKKFGGYLKRGLNPGEIGKIFKDTKDKILGA